MTEQKKEPERQKISRRDFLRNTGLLAGSAALGTTFLGGCTQAETTSAPAQTWDHETDVVIVGLGGAGAAAAWAAGTAGAEVTALEIRDVAGGSTDICGGLITLGGGNALQKAAGFEDDVENLYNFLMTTFGTGANQELVRVFADQSLDLYTWLTGTIGVKFNPGYTPLWPEKTNHEAGLTCTDDCYNNEYKGIAFGTHRQGWASSERRPNDHDGSGFFRPVLRAAEAIPTVKIMYETEGKELVFDHEARRVIGVKALQGEKTIAIKARKAVILTTGGFANNQDMVEAYCPAYLGLPSLGTGFDKGAGIRMAQAVGADVKNMDCVLPLIDLGAMGAFTQSNTTGGPVSQGILVNQLGARFVAEDHYYDWITTGMLKSQKPDKHNPSYAIFDAKVFADVPDAASNESVSSNGSKEQLKKVIVAEANSITELANTLGMPEGVLEYTVNFYNTGVAQGKDPLFNKQAKFLSKPIATPPFYALKVTPGLIATTGGLRINTNAQVLSVSDGVPIKGLYSAGRNASELSGQKYGGSGTSTASCYVFGRIAGSNAAAETAWS